MNRETEFASAVSGFSDKGKAVLEKIPAQGGALFGGQVREMLHESGWSQEELMIRLLPLARIFAVAPVSRFRVGAVVLAEWADRGDYGLFLGANLEFPAQALNQSIHAEQAALVNAWHQGARKITALAVTHPPCGHCRQFLAEYGPGAGEVRVITPDRAGGPYVVTLLGTLLPQAFGPQDLGNLEGLAEGGAADQESEMPIPSVDPLVLQALDAARSSYAPYTGNLAGCALGLGPGRIIAGSYVENAAFNPSLSPLHTAVIRLNLSSLEEAARVERAVLVEKAAIISQKGAVKSVLETWAPQVHLEYSRIEM